MLTIAWFELKRMLRIKTVLLNQFLLPILLIFILGTSLSSVFEGRQELNWTPMKVAIVQQGKADEQQIWNSFISWPSLDELLNSFNAESREEAQRMLRSGEADFAVVVPADFEQRIVTGGQTRLELIRGRDAMRNMVAESLFNNFVKQVNTGQAVTMIMMHTPPQAGTWEQWYSHGASEGLLKPGKLGKHGSYTAFQFYAVSMLIMFMLYCGMTVSHSLNNEKSFGTLARMYAAPIRGNHIFFGKILGNMLVSMVQVLFIIMATRWIFGVNWGSHPWLLAIICMLVIFISMCMAVILTFSITAPSVASTVISMMIVVMTFISGGMTPQLPGWLNVIGKGTVNYWGMEGMLLLIQNGEPAQIWPSICTLCAIALGLLLITGMMYKKVGYR
ncbi:ABC-2 family transporter protein [compost metagenome]